MKIVVLAGGLSPERNVSLSSGSMICQALREKGHRVALVDLFFGLEDYEGELEALYEVLQKVATIRSKFLKEMPMVIRILNVFATVFYICFLIKFLNTQKNKR